MVPLLETCNIVIKALVSSVSGKLLSTLGRMGDITSDLLCLGFFEAAGPPENDVSAYTPRVKVRAWPSHPSSATVYELWDHAQVTYHPEPPLFSQDKGAGCACLYRVSGGLSEVTEGLTE